MAYTEDDIARIMRQVEAEMETFGRISQETADRLRDAQMGIKGFSEATRIVGTSMKSLGQAGADAAKAMYENKQGAAAFNQSLDGLSEAAKAASVALALIAPGGPVVKGLLIGIGLITEALVGVSKAANKMADDLYKGYSQVAKSGAMAGDGMTGVFRGAQKLGLGMDQLGSYVQLVTDNAKDLATFGGTVFEGRKQFEDMGKAMEPYRKELMEAGYTQEQINDAQMSYLRLQTKVGLAQNQTVQQLAEGAKKYLAEQEALTKITGMTRQEQEKAIEQARAQQRFRAHLDELRATGDEKNIALARQQEIAYAMLARDSKELAQGFGDALTGAYESEAANKYLMGTLGKGADIVTDFNDGNIDAIKAVQGIRTAAGETATDLRDLAKYSGGFEKVFGNYAELSNLGVAAQKDLNVQYQEALKQVAGSRDTQDDITKQYAARMKEQQEVMLSMQSTVFDTIKTAGDTADEMTHLAGELAEAFKNLTDVINELIPAITQVVKYVGSALKGVNEVIKAEGVEGKVAAADKSGLTEKVAGAATGYAGMQMGAAAGSLILPGIGTVIGGALGGIGGYLAGSYLGGKAGEAARENENPPGRAAGGPVNEKKPYMVGEKGPELFVPQDSGKIVPNNTVSKFDQYFVGLSKNIENMFVEPAKTVGQMGKSFDEMLSMADEFVGKGADSFKDIIRINGDISKSTDDIYQSVESNLSKQQEWEEYFQRYVSLKTDSLNRDLASVAEQAKTIQSISEISDSFAQLTKLSDKFVVKTDDYFKTTGKYDDLIEKNTEVILKLSDSTLVKNKEWEEFYSKYVTKKKELLGDDLNLTKDYSDLVTNMMGPDGSITKMLMTMGQQPTAQQPAGGQGIKMPTAPSMPSMGGGQGMQVTSQQDLSKMGLKIKSGDVQAENAGISPQLIKLAQAIQETLPNFAYFSGFNDKFHQEKSPSSKHTQGRAVDFALSSPPTPEQGQEIIAQLKSMGASLVIDEYNNPSAKATAGHIHAEIPALADGGLITKPQIAMIGEEGPEAVIPLDGSLIDYKQLADALKSALVDVLAANNSPELIDSLAELVRLQKESVSTQQRILSVSYN